jgi:hypothetical protein
LILVVEMSLSIQIIRNGILEKTIHLAPGKYTLGRDGVCDITLDDKGVSKNHATLTVLPDRVSVNDTGSLNGIYYHGERINNKTLSRDFEVEIAPFMLKVELKKKDDKFKGRRFSFTFAFVYFPLNSQVKNFRSQELIKRGIILARYLSEMNRYFLESGQYDLVRTNPVSKEEGVIYSFIIDVEGKIIAPAENAGNFFDWPELAVAVKKGGIEVGKGKGEEKVIFYPITAFNKIIGAAVIGYDIERAVSVRAPDVSGYSYVLLMFLLALCGILGIFLIKTFLRPLKQIEEEASIALKEGRDHLTFRSPYREVDNLVSAFNRILVRLPAEGTKITSETDPGRSADIAENASGEFLSELDQITCPWCIVDSERLVISQYNHPFITIFGNSRIKQGAHVAEAFDNPDILNAISTLIDSPEKEDSVVVDIEETPFEIKKKIIEGGKNKVIFMFEGSSDE